MAWEIEWDARAVKEMKKIDISKRGEIVRYLKEKIASGNNPRLFGKSLTGDKIGLWRYRLGDYRIICKIEDSKLVVLVVAVGHRREVYN